VFVALGVQHAMLIRHIVICGLPRSIIFFHIISKSIRFSEKVIKHNMCVDYLYNFFLILNLRGTERDMGKNVYWSSCKVTIFIVIF